MDSDTPHSRLLRQIVSARGLFQILPEASQVDLTWEGLIAKYAVQGKQAHDTCLVALMIEHRVAKLRTCNDADSRRFIEIEPANPLDVLAIASI
jgi:hypothetical protein